MRIGAKPSILKRTAGVESESLRMTVVLLAVLSLLGSELSSLAAESRTLSAEPLAAEPTTTVSQPTNPTGSSGPGRSFQTKGVVREISASGGTLTVRHEAVPGVMPSMTMEFAVHDTNLLRGLQAGDNIGFEVHTNTLESWIERLWRTNSSAGAELSSSSVALTNLLPTPQLQRGNLLPDVSFITEEGKTIRLSSFRGQVLAFTFLFTRCPLPDFCPRMSGNFRESRELLMQQVAGPTNWQFLSISFDPEFDRPAVLQSYAQAYRGVSRDHWLFASASTNAMASLAGNLGFRFAKEGGSFVHNLRTVVLDPHGRVFQQFPGNKWTPEQLAEAMRAAARP